MLTQLGRPHLRGGANPMFVLVSAILVVAGLVIAMNMGDPGTKAARSDAVEEDFDPFADVPPDTPRLGPAASAVKPAADSAKSSSPFAGVASFQDDPIWVAANVKADEADELLQAALAAHSDGDRKTAQEKGERAKTLYTEALEDSLPLQHALSKDHGPESRPVERMSRLRQKWTRQVMTLKKAAFL